MKRILAIISILALSVSFTAQATKDTTTQRIGFLTQLAATAAIHTAGNALIKSVGFNSDFSVNAYAATTFIAVCKHILAKRAQMYLSDEVFDFGPNDWAAAENNYANFLAWIWASSKLSITSTDSGTFFETELLLPS